jgi:hypothetical protein
LEFEIQDKNEKISGLVLKQNIVNLSSKMETYENLSAFLHDDNCEEQSNKHVTMFHQ